MIGIRTVVVSNRFGELAGSLDSTLETALDAGTSVCITTAFGLARVDTGAMRSNVTVEASAGYREIVWNEGHAPYNEFGTIHMSAQPFAGPGADAAVPVIESHLAGWGR